MARPPRVTARGSPMKTPAVDSTMPIALATIAIRRTRATRTDMSVGTANGTAARPRRPGSAGTAFPTGAVSEWLAELDSPGPGADAGGAALVRVLGSQRRPP